MMFLYAYMPVGGHYRLSGRFLSGKTCAVRCLPGRRCLGAEIVPTSCSGISCCPCGSTTSISTIRAGYFHDELKPRVEGLPMWRRHPRSEPLVSREGQLPAVGCANQFAAGHRAHGLRPLRRGVDAARRCAALGGHSGPAVSPAGRTPTTTTPGSRPGPLDGGISSGPASGTGARPGVVQRPGQPAGC